MRIGLITDTHIPRVALDIPPEVFEVFRGVDLILHGGDIYQLRILDALGEVAPVLAALGDDDPEEFLDDERVAIEHHLEFEGKRLLLVHERPWRYHMPERDAASPDIIVHGHTHDTEIRQHGGILFVGSGSPTFFLYRHGLGTVGLLNITAEGAAASIVHL